jgi:hypothetical protein
VPWTNGRAATWIEDLFAMIPRTPPADAPEPESFDPAAVIAAHNSAAERHLQAMREGRSLESLAAAPEGATPAPAPPERLPHPYRARR